MHWKIKRDPFYSEIPESSLEEAGFFYDTSKEDVDIMATLDIMSTPLSFIKNTNKAAILVLTGCFAPAHEGHFQAMEAARQRLLFAGYENVYGFYAPDHDEYTSQKTGKNIYTIDERIKILHEATKNIEWCRIDTWPGLFCKHAVNFTDVMHRLQNYIARHLNTFIPVFLVAGGDNANHALTFANKGGCVIVTRPGEEEFCQKYSHLENGKNILFATANNDSSSTKIRAAAPYNKPIKSNLILRVDNSNPKEVAISKVISEFYNEVTIVTVQEQKEKLESLRLAKPIISLDPYIKGDYQLEISRCYDYMGMSQLYFTPRPNSTTHPFDIPEGQFVLYDDDICSGRTMDFAEQLLSQCHCERLSFVKSAPGVEVLDARDFIYAEENGGLVMQTRTEQRRLPYVLPFVNPAIRASALDSRAFSEAIWRANIEIQEGESQEICKKYALMFA